MSTKEALIEIIRGLPDEMTAAEAVHALTLRLEIKERLEELDRGEGVSHEEARKRLARWLD
jgi:predicted transcriptional regulator